MSKKELIGVGLIYLAIASGTMFATLTSGVSLCESIALSLGFLFWITILGAGAVMLLTGGRA